MNILTKQSIERQTRLNDIAIDRYLNGLGTLGKLGDIIDIQQDNLLTDVELQKYFSDGLLHTPSEVTELHLRRCEDSGVEYCICLADKKVIGGVL